ncbi:hypothetical protein SDC9_152685 [bioreactor metagenome]|uniref:Uncharacterized protein n=1 Tax=bioreactor metagenome TaxID=1076179 RepID=A0A645ETS9_9ZZZZ
MGPGDLDTRRGAPDAADQHQRHHHCQQNKVHAAIKAQTAWCTGHVHAGCGIGQIGLALFPHQLAVYRIKNGQQRQREEQHLSPDMTHCPEKVHALQEAQKQRRITQWHQRATGVRDDKDEKHHHMGLMTSVVVGAQQGAYQQHGSPRRAHEAGQHRTDSQDGGIQPRRTTQIAAHIDASSHRVQGSQQDHERQILGQQGVHQIHARRTQAIDQRKRQQEGQRPAGSDPAEMVMPELRQQQRHQRNRQQHAHKRQAPGHGHGCAVNVCGLRGGRG